MYNTILVPNYKEWKKNGVKQVEVYMAAGQGRIREYVRAQTVQHLPLCVNEYM
jgi:hypothetical protein